MSNTFQRVSHRVEHRGLTIPTFIYGTAWKESQTESLTRLAIASGFRGIDTANQRRHYYEEGVGRAIRGILNEGNLTRRDLFLQTKFTYAPGQDHRLPYDPHANFTSQVQQSFESSLAHLGISQIDSYVLHGPSSMHDLTEADWEVWRAMETLKNSGAVKLIGVSNIGYDQLQRLMDGADVKPAFVQNRCFARTQWDSRIRALCRKCGIIYQGFSLLTANAAELNRPEIHVIARRRGCSTAQLVFRFALQVGMIPLTGTTRQSHMQEDLAVYDIELSEAEIHTIENIAL